ENTHNMAGGRVLDVAASNALFDAAHELGLLVHVDGARLANAAVACGVAARELVERADSVSLCLSKGLGAPVGSLLAGSEAFVQEARRARKAFGGGMRQAGVLAAAGLLALEEGPRALAVDHRRAVELAAGLDALPGVVAARPDTNIVMVELERHAPAELLRFLAERRVRALQVGPGRLRFVLHRDLAEGDVERCVAAVAEY